MALQNENVCKFHKHGFCKFRSTCRKQHNKKYVPKLIVKLKNVAQDILRSVGTIEILDTVNLVNGVYFSMKVRSPKKT